MSKQDKKHEKVEMLFLTHASIIVEKTHRRRRHVSAIFRLAIFCQWTRKYCFLHFDIILMRRHPVSLTALEMAFPYCLYCSWNSKILKLCFLILFILYLKFYNIKISFPIVYIVVEILKYWNYIFYCLYYSWIFEILKLYFLLSILQLKYWNIEKLKLYVVYIAVLVLGFVICWTPYSLMSIW